MGISNFTNKLSRFCAASSEPGFEGLSLNFHEAGHGLNAMTDGADSVLDNSVSTPKPSVFREPGR